MDFPVTECIESLAEKSVWIGDGVVDPDLVDSLEAVARAYRLSGAFQPAKVGRAQDKIREASVRGDSIFWLPEENPDIQRFYKFLEIPMEAIRKELYLPVRRFEGHFAHYAPGQFYETHVDRHRGTTSRLVSCVLYLSSLGEEDGGELVIFPDHPEKKMVVSPQRGRLVLFISEGVPHQVLAPRLDRLSLTGWMRSD